MTLGEAYEQFERLNPIAEALVKERIRGTRKGLPDEQNYSHSLRVQRLVMDCHHWDDPDHDVFLAALLHDVIEDGGVTFEELQAMGFTSRTIDLVRLCTHPLAVENSTERWTLMMAKLVEARDDDAWRIKLADLTDNLRQSVGLTPENRKFMVEVKAPLMLRLTERYIFIEEAWRVLWREMEKQRKEMAI